MNEPALVGPDSGIAVVGGGAIGTLFAAALTQNGHRVTLCARRSTSPLTVVSLGAHLRVDVDPVSDVRQVRGPVRCVVLATKTHDTEGARDWIESLCGPGTLLVVAQNGIDQEARVIPMAQGARVVPALVYANVERESGGTVRHRAGDRIVCPAGAGSEAFSALLGAGILRVELAADFLTASWIKLLGNLAVNPLTALTGRRLEVLGSLRVRAAAAEVVREAASVANADGATVRPSDVESVLAAVDAYPPSSGTTMLFDRLAGRRMETEALVSVVVGRARRHGVAVPRIELLATLLDAVETTEAPSNTGRMSNEEVYG